VRRADEDDRVAEERLEGDAAMPAGRADDSELELTGCDALDDRLRVEDRERDPEVGVAVGEVAEELRDDDPAGACRGPDLEGSAQLLGAFQAELGDDLLLEREQPLRAAVEAQARLGRLDAAAGAVEQLRPEALLERAHLQAHRRLGHAEPRRRLREALALDDGAERAQLTCVHKGILCTSLPPEALASAR